MMTWVVYRWTEEFDTFTLHALSRTGKKTACDLRIPKEDDSSTWFYDHDRDDVIPCETCKASLTLEESIYFDIDWIIPRVWSALTTEETQVVTDLRRRIEELL
jgi:hypothetical protein